MEKRRSKTAERILDLTLEIIYLLTGENYISFKLSDGLVASNFLNNQSPKAKPPSHSPRQDKKKVQEVTREIIELLTGEVPIRCQDVTVYFSMEEWDYLEGHKELYKDVMEENWPPFKTPDGSSKKNPPESVPHPQCSQDSTQQRPPCSQDSTQQRPPCSQDSTQQRPPCSQDSTQQRPPCSQDSTQQRPPCSQDSTQQRPPCSQDSTQQRPPCSQDSTQQRPPCSQDSTQQRPLCSRDSTKQHPLCSWDSTKQRPLCSWDSTKQSPTCSWDSTKQLPLCSWDSTPQHQLYSWDSAHQHQENTQEDQNEGFIEVVVGEDQNVMGDNPCKAVVVPPEISTDPEGTQRAVRAEQELEHVKIRENIPQVIDTVSLDDDITCDSSGERPMNLSLPPASYVVALSSDLAPHSVCFPDHSPPITHHEAHKQGEPFSLSGESYDQGARFAFQQLGLKRKKPYSCLECGKCFPRKQELIGHQRTHKTIKSYQYNMGEKPYSCAECGKCFAQKHRLTTHEKTHAEEKSHSCLHCGKCFTFKYSLIRHEKIHTGEKPFQCSVCWKRFSNSQYLNLHWVTHTGEKPYSCLECGKSFARKSVLKRHAQVHKRRSFIPVNAVKSSQIGLPF